VETRNDDSKTTSKIGDKNRIDEQFIPSQTFHRTPGGRVQETTAGEQFEPRNLESFDPVTQDLYQLLPAMIHTQIGDYKRRCITQDKEPNVGTKATAVQIESSCVAVKNNRTHYLREKSKIGDQLARKASLAERWCALQTTTAGGSDQRVLLAVWETE
jgi:hypothetical protein